MMLLIQPIFLLPALAALDFAVLATEISIVEDHQVRATAADVVWVVLIVKPWIRIGRLEAEVVPLAQLPDHVAVAMAVPIAGLDHQAQKPEGHEEVAIGRGPVKGVRMGPVDRLRVRQAAEPTPVPRQRAWLAGQVAGGG